MNFTVNGVRYRSHNGVFPVKRRFGTDAVLVHLRTSASESNKTGQHKHNVEEEQQSQVSTKKSYIANEYNSCGNSVEDNNNTEQIFRVCAMDRRGYALITDGGEYEVRSFEVNQNATSSSPSNSASSCHRWAKRESRKRMSMKLGSQSISCTTKMNCSSHKYVNKNYQVDEDNGNDNNFLDDENVPLSLQFSISSITKERKLRRKPGNYVHFIGKFLSTFAGTAFKDASRQWQTFTAQEKAAHDVQELIDKVAASGQYQRRVLS